jgi:predicted acetyltransferase
VPRAQLRTVPGDGLALTSPLPLEDVGPAEPWLLRIVDAPVAVAGRGWPDGPPGVAEFRLHDDLAPWHAGDWRLVVEEGAGRLERGGSGAAEIHVRGLAALYTCYTGCATLRRAGLLHGDASGDPVLDRLFAGPRAGMLDAF